MAAAFQPLGALPPAVPFRPTSLVAMPEPPPIAPEPEAPPAADLEAALAAAREEGRAMGFVAGQDAARAEAAASQAAQLCDVLQAAAAAVEEARGAALQAVEENAQAIARLVVAMLDAALPQAAAREATDLALRLANQLRPVLADLPGFRLHVPPGIAEEVEARAGQPWLEVVGDPAIAPGDARATWRGGEARMTLAERRAAIRAVLAEAGLDPED